MTSARGCRRRYFLRNTRGKEIERQPLIRVLLCGGSARVNHVAFALGRTQYPPARKMVELGLAIVLATDFNPGSSPVPSMPFMLSLACIEMKLLPAEALTAATINAAWSLDLGNHVGSLEVGKEADFVIHEFADYRELAYFVAALMRPKVYIGGEELAC